MAARLGIPEKNIFANRLLFKNSGEFEGFDAKEYTSRSGGKAAAVQHIRGVHNYRTLVMIGDGATDLEVSLSLKHTPTHSLSPLSHSLTHTHSLSPLSLSLSYTSLYLLSSSLSHTHTLYRLSLSHPLFLLSSLSYVHRHLYLLFHTHTHTKGSISLKSLPLSHYHLNHLDQLQAKKPGGADLFICYGGVQLRSTVAAAADWLVLNFDDLCSHL